MVYGAADICANRQRSEFSARWSYRSCCYSCETWTLTGELRGRLHSFGTISLRWIIGYRWYDYGSNDLVLREPGLGQVTCIIRDNRLRLYGHVARFPAEDPAHGFFLSRSKWLDHAEGASIGFIVASGGVLSEGDGQDEGGRSTVAWWTR